MMFKALYLVGLVGLVFVGLTACADMPVATPALARIEPLGGYRFVNHDRGPNNTSSLLIVVTFSGGGTRAAALAYGVLEELARTEIELP